jgi:hypothetical protein
MTHHDYTPGARVQVCIARPGRRAAWLSAEFLGTRVGATHHSRPFLVVQTRDGVVHDTCAPEYVRAV